MLVYCIQVWRRICLGACACLECSWCLEAEEMHRIARRFSHLDNSTSASRLPVDDARSASTLSFVQYMRRKDARARWRTRIVLQCSVWGAGTHVCRTYDCCLRRFSADAGTPQLRACAICAYVLASTPIIRSSPLGSWEASAYGLCGIKALDTIERCVLQLCGQYGA